MKLNQFALLGVASLMLISVPVARAVTPQSSVHATPPIVAQAQSIAIESGTFVAGETPTTGTARIVVENGHRYLELDAAFSTGNMGPDLHVLLDNTNRPPQSYENLGSVVNLGKLQNYSGAQRYPIPDAINLDNFQSVVIWCRMANAIFGHAPLNPVTNARVQ
jgi:hypothetical protein